MNGDILCCLNYTMTVMGGLEFPLQHGLHLARCLLIGMEFLGAATPMLFYTMMLSLPALYFSAVDGCMETLRLAHGMGSSYSRPCCPEGVFLL